MNLLEGYWITESMSRPENTTQPGKKGWGHGSCEVRNICENVTFCKKRWPWLSPPYGTPLQRHRSHSRTGLTGHTWVTWTPLGGGVNHLDFWCQCIEGENLPKEIKQLLLNLGGRMCLLGYQKPRNVLLLQGRDSNRRDLQEQRSWGSCRPATVPFRPQHIRIRLDFVRCFTHCGNWVVFFAPKTVSVHWSQTSM